MRNKRSFRWQALLYGSFLTILLAGCPDPQSKIEEIQRTQQEILAKLEDLEDELQRSGQIRRAPRAENYSKVYSIEVGDAPVKGDPDAPITLVAYSDFQCPFCARAAPQIFALEEKYSEKVRVVFKHFPLSIHKAARPVAIASLAAQEQDRFWEFHDAVFDSQRTLTGDLAQLEELAKTAGLDVERFRNDLERQRASYEQRIAADLLQGKSVDVRGTPALFINGKKVRDRSLAGMSAMVDVALAALDAS